MSDLRDSIDRLQAKVSAPAKQEPPEKDFQPMFSKLHQRWSTYIALAVWGAAGFMAQPNIASFVVHFFFLPVGLLAVILLAQHEGRSE